MTSVSLDLPLAQFSLTAIFASMALYTVAFLVFVWHLSAVTAKGKDAKASKLQSVGFWLLGTALLVHGFGVVARGISAARVPWANMYEFSISGSFILVAIFMASLRVKDIRIIASLVTGFALLVLGSATSLFYVQVKTLMPALQSYWLVIHVTVAVLATAFFNIAAALSVAYLLKTWGYVQTSKLKGVILLRKVLSAFPDELRLERLQVRFNSIGLVLWTFTLIAGAIWAQRAWHRFWGWDTKEVWTLIIWILYAGYFHATSTRGWTGKRAAWLSLIGFSAVIFNFTIVNLFFKGLHVYSGL
ncbi:MAG: c-type cytochrome biogenesis protein CcsB [Microbacteriaceae bacterium]